MNLSKDNFITTLKGQMSDSPRFLTNDEINSLLNRIAKPQISSSEIRDHVYNEVKTMFKYQLENIKLKPSKIEKMGIISQTELRGHLIMGNTCWIQCG